MLKVLTPVCCSENTACLWEAPKHPRIWTDHLLLGLKLFCWAFQVQRGRGLQDSRSLRFNLGRCPSLDLGGGRRWKEDKQDRNRSRPWWHPFKASTDFYPHPASFYQMVPLTCSFNASLMSICNGSQHWERGWEEYHLAQTSFPKGWPETPILLDMFLPGPGKISAPQLCDL